MNNVILITPLEGQKALVSLLGNEAPCVTDIYESNSREIIRYINDKAKKRELSKNSVFRKAVKFLNQFIYE